MCDLKGDNMTMKNVTVLSSMPRKNKRNITEIITYIKALLLPKNGNKKIFDNHVADELSISLAKLQACKKRDKIPYEDLFYYCQKNNISTDELFFQ